MSDARSEAPMLSVEDLSVVFRTDKERVHALDGVNFDIREGETVGLVGESGSGKSVTARSILGLINDPGRIESGAIRFRGRDLTDVGWTDARGDIAIVFQDPSGSLNPVYTVGNQIREALKIHRGLTGRAAREEAIRLLESVGIPDAPGRVNAYPNEFSGGMRQRAVIATALACDPDLLVCDEPTTALDVTIQAQILDLLDDLQRESGLSILFITHDMGVVSTVADRVNVMYAGEIVERAPADRLFSDPAHPYTRGLLASIPSVGARGDRLLTIDGEVPTPNEAPTACRFAPRCPKAFEACDHVHPKHVDQGGGQSAACLLFEEEHTTPVTPETGRPGVADTHSAAETDGGTE
ncbi:MAG: ABC transporter ATP-binding protein [Halolamina sp.]|uniref:ABC transporter ATP-binding protein n=1 Tax=Halolamina sp. TaxID=1940283 RepID=UPI002FC39A65